MLVKKTYHFNINSILYNPRNLRIILLLCLLLIDITLPFAGEEKRQDNSTVTVCMASDIISLDPTDHRSRVTQIVLKNIFDSLTARDSRNNVIPQLAESWSLINDTEWEFRLKRGVKFHNGDELKASDAAFTFNRIIYGEPPGYIPTKRRALYSAVTGIFVLDDYTLRIRTSYPWPGLPVMFSLQEIVPEKYMKEKGPAAFTRMPVGTGPFKYKSRTKGEKIVLERFDDYYGGSSERPPVQAAPLKNLVFRIVTSYPDQVAMLKKRECNIITDVPGELLPVLKISGDIDIYNIPATRCYFADVNCSRPFFKDVRCRKALNYAVDVEAIIKQKFPGNGSILATVFLPNTRGYNPDLKPYPYDPETARRLFKESDFPMDYVISIHAHRSVLLFADGISMYLTKLGIKSRVKLVDGLRPDKTGNDASWDIFVGSWGNTTLDPMGIVVPKLCSGGSDNYSGFVSKELDRLVNEARHTMSDLQRKEYFYRIQQIIFNESPMIFGYAPDEFYAVTENVRNFIPSITGMLEMHDVFSEEN